MLSSRFVFYGSSTIFLPAVRSRKPRSLCGCRDLVMASGAAWAGGRVGPSEQNCNTSPQICGGRRAMAVTALTIHDIVISPRFPPPIFCSKAFRFQHKRCSLAGSINQNCLISACREGAQ